MLRIKEIAWVAGMLEGEGCFRNSHSHQKDRFSARIIFGSTDFDIVERVAAVLGSPSVGKVQQRKRMDKKGLVKPFRFCNVYGSHAIAWMMTIYPLMGERRQAKIRELIAGWKASQGKGCHGKSRDWGGRFTRKELQEKACLRT